MLRSSFYLLLWSFFSLGRSTLLYSLLASRFSALILMICTSKGCHTFRSLSVISDCYLLIREITDLGSPLSAYYEL